MLGVFAMRCSMILCHFQHRTLWCDLAKIITAPLLIFAVICAMPYGLEFSQNYNCIAFHFCIHMCSVMYKMLFEPFEDGIFFKFWAFSTQPQTNLCLYFGSSFKLLSQFFFILDQLSKSTLAKIIKFCFFKLGLLNY